MSSELIGISFTSIHMPLVKTPMIAPTRIYDPFPAISPAQAADLVLKAMRHKPHEINTLIGTAGEVSHSIAPNTAFRVLPQAYKIFPDSAAARAANAGETVSRQQKTLARVLKGVHWQALFWATHTVGWRHESSCSSCKRGAIPLVEHMTVRVLRVNAVQFLWLNI